MVKQKITDEQINRHLSEGMSQRAIADLYDMDPPSVSRRISKMRKNGALETVSKRKEAEE